MSKSNVAPEAAYFNQLVDLEGQKRNIADEVKATYAEAKEAGLDIKGLKLAVKRHLETHKKRNDRLDIEAEADRILAALGEYVNTPLGNAAVQALHAS